MERRNGFLTFLASLIPGVGYMYLGLIRKGAEALLIFMLIPPVLRFIGLGFVSNLFTIPLWFYTFFDTFNIAKRMDRGEYVPDSEFIIKRNSGSFDSDINNLGNKIYSKLDRSGWKVVAWALIILGTMALLNKAFVGNNVYYILKSYVNTYFIPVILILGGIYMLTKNKH